MTTPTIEAEARLRAKNQLTVPEAIVEILDVRQNDLLVFEANAQEPGTALVRVVPRTFAGTLTGVFGTTEDVKAFLREEHADWERPAVGDR
jgi:hypothetical protein